MLSIRGAITIEENTIEDIEKNSIELMKKIIEKNNLDLCKIKALIFSCTKDITKAYPGAFIRKKFKLNKVSIMHFNEMEVEGSLNMCIRVTVISDEDEREVHFVYLKNAEILRLDIKDS
ncbi:chorismate mutase [Clostridium senegalense]|uniref:chorismate mutase n=1 Tax=Clostridium senegalense TaxID=1465809 RepID=UPI001C11AB03|nr:chorismate mutase [Clostridium senegalense]MBU5225220.1 chorismate mutase [Clostridium senegalense]